MKEWAKYFRDNAGSQERAWGVLEKYTQSFDEKFGTDLSSTLKQELKHVCSGSRIAAKGPC